jgi:hypothetical protein
MSHNGRFPSKDANLNGYFLSAQPFLIANTIRFFISTSNIDALNTNFGQWRINYPLSTNPDTRTTTITTNKNIDKKNMLKTLRAIFADIPQSALTTEDRNTLRLQQRKTTYSAADAPATSPKPKIDTSNRLQHSISFTDEAAGNSAAKPADAHGCEIYMKIGSPAATISELQYVATCTKPPFINHFDLADAGKPAYYRLRWVNAHGKPGPWSGESMATING